MLKRLLKNFKGDRKYFTIVFFILILIFVSGFVTPYIIDYKRQHWETEQKNKLLEIERFALSSFTSKEADVLNTADWLRDNLSKTLQSTTYQYRKLIELVNKEEVKDYSLEVVAPNGKLIAWNENLAIKQKDVFPLAYPLGQTYFHSNGLLIYLTVIDTVIVQNDIFYVIVSKLIEKNYTLQNEYFTEISFSKEISDKFLTQCIIDYNPFVPPRKDGRIYSFNLINYRGTKIGQVNVFKPSLNVAVSEIKDLFAEAQGILVVLACFFMAFGFRNDFLSIKSRFVRIITLIISLSIIRVLFFIVNFPSMFLEGPLVDPANFSSTFAWGLVKSPIEFFVTNLFVVVIAVQIFRYVYNYYRNYSAKKFTILKVLITPVLAIIFYYLLRGLSASIKSVIFDSTIRYFKDPTPIPDPNILFMNLNVLMLGSAVILVMVGLLILIGLFLRLLDKQSKTNLKFTLFFLTVEIGGFIFFMYQPEPLITQLMVILFILLIGVLVYLACFRSRNVAQNIVYITIAASFISVTMMNYFNLELETRSLKTVAFEIIRANENLINYMIDETLSSATEDDELVNSFLMTNINYNAQAFRIWSKSPMQRESINSAVVLYDAEMNELGKFAVGIGTETNLFDTLNVDEIKEQQIISVKKNIDGNTDIYAGMVPVYRNDLVSGFVSVLIEFNIQNIGSRNFPDFLESNKTLLGSVIDVSQLRIFEFTNGKVTQVFGDIYPSREQTLTILGAPLSEFNEAWITFSIYDENYIAYVIKLFDEGNERVITVAAKEKEITWNLFNFFKIFLVHSILILILFFGMLLAKALKLEYSFRTKLLFALLLVSIIPIAVLAVYNRQVVSERSEKAIFDELSGRSDYLEKHVRAQLAKHYDRDLVDAFKNAGKELDISFGVYDNTDLIYTSRQVLYNTGLFSNKLSPNAHYNLNYLSYREYLSKEHIDKFIYDAYYRKVSIGGVPLIISVNDAFNKIHPAFSTSDIDVILFGIYSFAVILIIIISMILANQISAPIRRLTKATEAVAKGDLNVELENTEKGEMKELYDGFNSMTKELQKNQVELAELEREAAWKEMAKQVAHEIKNPLTPIKLAVQQLVASYNEKREDFDEIFHKVTTTVLNQIENLSQIASEFSTFAKMPSIKLEVLDFIPVINDTINLFVDEKIKLKFESEVETAMVEADSSQLRRMIINLIRNSIQANATEVMLQLTQKGDNYSLVVIDNGEGIKDEYKDKIFEINFTTKEKGMGLGLKLAKRFLEGIHGKIHLVSTGPSGTTFEILIPKYQSEEEIG